MVYVRFDESNTVEQVIAHLDRNTDVQRLRCCKLLDDESFQAVLEFLHNNYHRFHLRALLIPSNSFTPLSSLRLAQVLQSRSLRLEELDFSDNSSALKRDGLDNLVEALSSSNDVKLKKLNLSNNDLGKTKARVAPLRQLLSGAAAIEDLDLSHNNIARKIADVCDGLLDNSSIRRLDLSSNSLKEKVGCVCKALYPGPDSVCGLQELNLSFNYITAAGAKHVKEYLCFNPHLVKLDLSLNRIGEEGARLFYDGICHNYALRELNLSRNSIGLGGPAIAEGLLNSQHTILEAIDLSWNELEDETAIVLARVLETKSILVSLNLAVNSIGDLGINALARALHADVSLKELDIRGNQMRDPGELIQLIVNGNYTLENLHYQMKNFLPEQAAQLENAFLFRENKKTWLGDLLRRIEAYAPGSFDRINLNLGSRKFGDEEILLLADALNRHRPPVSSIEIPETSRVTNAGISRLSRLCLQEIHVERFYVDGCTLLANIAGANGSLGKAIRAPRCPLRCITLSQCELEPQFADLLASDIRNNRSLKKLILSRNNLGDNGAREILAAALEHPTLISLDLSDNRLTDEALLGMKPIRRLRQLFLRDNEITDAGALDLAKAVMNSQSIDWLKLQGNQITSKGEKALQLFLRNSFILEVRDTTCVC